MEKIIITPLFGIGDTLMTTPALELLKKHKHDCHITCFTLNPAAYQILINNPHIDNLITCPINNMNIIQSLATLLKTISFRFDTSLSFYPSNRREYNLFSLITGCKTRIGHTYLNMNLSQLNFLKNKSIQEKGDMHCVEENIRLLRFFNIPADVPPPMHVYLSEDEVSLGNQCRQELGSGPIIGIHAGTSTFKSHINRRWPGAYFSDLINDFPDLRFVLFGAKSEVADNKTIWENCRDRERVTICDNKTIREVAALIGTLDGFVSNDSGLMHVASAMKVPTVAILGPTNQNFIHPWHVKHKIVSLNLPCSPCFIYSPKPLTCKLDGSFKCLQELQPQLVSQALKELLADNADIGTN